MRNFEVSTTIRLWFGNCHESGQSLQWRHNGRDGVWNHRHYGCLLNRLFGCRSKKTSKLRLTGLCVGFHRGPVNSPRKGPVTRKMFPFEDVIMCWHSVINVRVRCSMDARNWHERQRAAWVASQVKSRSSFNILQWRHNEHDGVSDHQPHDCLLNRLFRPKSKKTSKLRVTGLCVGNSPGNPRTKGQ